MEFTLDLPWPWSLSPVDGLQLLTAGLLPSFLARLVVAVLAALVALPSWRGASPVRIAVATLVGLIGYFLARQPLLVLAIVFVVYFTLATYRGSPKARGGRLLLLIALRLLILLLTLFTVARPAIGIRSDNRVPSILLIGVDTSESMSAIHDEVNGKSREEAVKAMLKKCQPTLNELLDDNQITTKVFRFDSKVDDYDLNAPPPSDGKRSDYGLMLNTLYERFGHESNLRGLLIVGDGADNGLRYQAAGEAGKFKTIQCQIDAFVTGDDHTNSNQKDLALTSLIAEPSPVYVKGRMTLRATVNAVGCENAPVEAHLYVDDKEVTIEHKFVNKEEVTEGRPAFPLREKNDFVVEATAPQIPGEVRVTLKLSGLPGEVTLANNEISTYVTVIKEGVSVLLVDQVHEESKFLAAALASDPRFRLTQVVRQTDAPPPPGEADLLKLERQAYDVIILGNVSAKRLAAGNPKILEKIRDLVKDNRVGFMMMGGRDSFGGTPEDPGSGDWRGTPIADLLPVTLDAVGQIDGKTEPLGIYPTEKGKQHYLLQIESTPEASDKAWEKLSTDPVSRPSGMNRLAKPQEKMGARTGAEVLATTQPGGKGEPVLVAQGYGKGRTLAFAMNTTSDWTKFGLKEGQTTGFDEHARFWKQTVLWLAQQENSEGSVWVKPDFRRVGSGAKQMFSVGVKGKTGMDLPGGKYEVRVLGPDGSSNLVPVSREGTADRGVFWKTDVPGEYRIEVTGAARDVDGKPVSGRASVRFLVYQDDSELFDQAAHPVDMGNLAAAGGGRKQAYRLDDLPQFLKQLKEAKLPSSRQKTKFYPEWRKPTLSPFVPFLFVLFLTLFGLEWGLRRWWGLV
ncbi:MAG: glutamine amidotransferase [Gemmataceae bacterium]